MGAWYGHVIGRVNGALYTHDKNRSDTVPYMFVVRRDDIAEKNNDTTTSPRRTLRLLIVHRKPDSTNLNDTTVSDKSIVANSGVIMIPFCWL